MPMRPMPLALLAAAIALAGCAERPEPAPVVFRGTTPAARPAAPRPAPVVAPAVPAASAPDAQGVVDYGGYSAIVARPGDTVASMAGRVGLSPSALASYNGLPSGYAPRPGDELILPPAPSGPATVESAVLAPLGAPIEGGAATGADSGADAAATGAAAQPAPAPPAQSAATGFDLSQIEAAIGDTPTAPTPRQTPPVSASAPPAPVPQAAAPLVVAAKTPDATPAATPAARPEAQAAPATQAAAAPAPAAAPAARFVSPVSGAIVRPFNRTEGARSDGVDFAAPQGAAVVAAAPGQVALVSESLGGLGTIVLIRHEGDLLTVYGRVDGVTVKKGDRVQQGQTIGAVAPGASGRDPSLHFEVRQGAESVDPARYLPG